MVSTKTGTGREAAPGGVSIVWVGVFGYLFLCLNVLFFSSLLAAAPLMFQALSREDYWVESLTAVWFLLAGLMLFVTALSERRSFRRRAYIIGGMAMMFAASEEISWGQRIFGFATPDLLMRLNEQEEFNVHNIINGLFDIIYLNGALILCMATGAAFFCRKDRLFGIPLPSILLMLGFLLILSYTSGASLKELSGADLREYVMSIRRSVGGFFMIHERGGVLLLFLIFALFSRQVKLVIACAATLALVLALTYVNYHVNVSIESTHHIRASLFEVREYLFGLGCLFYCLEILLAQGRLAQSHGHHSPPPPGRFQADGSPFLMMSCYLVIAGSIGLILLGYFTAIARTAAIKEALWSVTADEPAARSDFDIYLRENAVIYLKSPCSAADVQAEFFLHVVPEDLEDLPADRRQHGFSGANFRYGEYAALDFGGQCIMEHPLPDYPIARIRTGQFTPEGDQIWMAEFPVGAVKDEPSPSTAVP